MSAAAGYALAATAFHLLTGAPPYQHSNPVAVISQHLTAASPKLSDQRPDLVHVRRLDLIEGHHAESRVVGVR